MRKPSRPVPIFASCCEAQLPAFGPPETQNQTDHWPDTESDIMADVIAKTRAALRELKLQEHGYAEHPEVPTAEAHGEALAALKAAGNALDGHQAKNLFLKKKKQVRMRCSACFVVTAWSNVGVPWL